MKTLKEEVMELLMDRIRVVEDEEFEACGKNSEYSTYKFHKDELLLKNDEGDWYKTDTWNMFIKYFEEYGFKKRPFKPKVGEIYFYVDTDGVIIDAMFMRHRILDILNRHTGNCFTTEKEACLHRDEMLKILNGEDDE